MYSILKANIRQVYREGWSIGYMVVLVFLNGMIYSLARHDGKQGLAFLSLLLVFAALMTIPRIFTQDIISGRLDIIRLRAYPIEGYVSIKMIEHWLCTGGVLLILSPLSALLLGIEVVNPYMFLVILFITTGVMSIHATLIASITAHVNQVGLLTSLLFLPLSLPSLIFANAALEASFYGFDIKVPLILLTTYMVFSLLISLFFSGKSLKFTTG